MSRKESLETLSKERPEMFGEAEEAEFIDVAPEDVQKAAPAATSQELALSDDFLMACGDGLDLPVERAKLDIQEAAGRMLEDYIRIGKRLFVIKGKLAHGEFAQYMNDEFPLSYRVGRECMLMTHRLLDSKVAHARQFYQVASGNSKKKALLLMGLSDEEVEKSAQSGEFLGKPLEEVGQMSYRQLQDEIRKHKRDLERTRAQRDKAESRIADLQEEVTVLREGADAGQQRPLTNLEMAFGRAVTQFGKLLQAAEDAPEEEIVRDGTTYLTRLMKEVTLIQNALQPWGPDAEPFPGAEYDPAIGTLDPLTGLPVSDAAEE